MPLLAPVITMVLPSSRFDIAVAMVRGSCNFRQRRVLENLEGVKLKNGPRKTGERIQVSYL